MVNPLRLAMPWVSLANSASWLEKGRGTGAAFLSVVLTFNPFMFFMVTNAVLLYVFLGVLCGFAREDLDVAVLRALNGVVGWRAKS